MRERGTGEWTIPRPRRGLWHATGCIGTPGRPIPRGPTSETPASLGADDWPSDPLDDLVDSLCEDEHDKESEST